MQISRSVLLLGGRGIQVSILCFSVLSLLSPFVTYKVMMRYTQLLLFSFFFPFFETPVYFYYTLKLQKLSSVLHTQYRVFFPGFVFTRAL